MKLIVDATCDIPKEFLDYVIVLPMYVTMGDKNIRTDELNMDEFDNFLRTSKTIPKTSQSSPKIIVDAVKKLDKNDDIIIFTISKKLSGQYNSVRLAMNLLKDYNITLIDSESITVEYGSMVIEIIRAIKNGKSKKEIINLIEDLKKRKRAIGILKSLDYLKKGGRIGKAKMLLGKLFGVKPVLTVKDGVIVPYGKNVKGEKNIVPFIMNEMKDANPELILLTHKGECKEFEELNKLMKGKFNCDIYKVDINPIILTHAGPEILFVSWIEK